MKTAFLFLVLFALNRLAAQTYILEGTLGKSSIYLQFTDDPAESKNRISDVLYFYKNSLKDIMLDGKFEQQRYVFWFNDEAFSLVKKSDGTFSGTWTNKSKSLPVSLHAVTVPLNHDADEPLDKIKEKLIGFRKDSTAVFNGKKIDWYCETHAVTPMFRLAGGYPKPTLEKINAVLEKMHYSLAIEQLDCANSYSYSSGSDIAFNIELGYLDDDLLGFSVFGYYDCGGAHPSGGSNGYLIDLHSGKSYQIDDVLAFDTSVADDETDNFDQFSAYREKYFGPKLYSLLQQKYQFQKPTDEDECDYTDLEVWQFASWKFTSKGIAFIPVFPHVSQNCTDTFLLPFDALRAYRNPLFPYRF